jgi:hypothetical protein
MGDGSRNQVQEPEEIAMAGDTHVKVLMLTRGGYTIVHRRPERGRFTFPSQVWANWRTMLSTIDSIGELVC